MRAGKTFPVYRDVEIQKEVFEQRYPQQFVLCHKNGCVINVERTEHNVEVRRMIRCDNAWLRKMLCSTEACDLWKKKRPGRNDPGPHPLEPENRTVPACAKKVIERREQHEERNAEA
jgi:hypothetical protein